MKTYYHQAITELWGITRLSEHKLYIASLVMIMASLYSDRDLNLIPELTFAFVENYIKENKFSSGKKSINKGFKYFSEGYIKDLKVLQQTDGNIVTITGKCFKSQRKSEDPHSISVVFEKEKTPVSIKSANCTCPIGTSASCGHITGLLYQLAKYKILGLRALPEDIAKTSQPQTWHTPRGEKIRGKVVQEIEVSSYHNSDNEREIAPKAIKSTLYNPVRGEEVDWKSKYEKSSETSSDMLILPALQNYDVPMVNTKFGKHCKGSTLSYHQPIESDCIINIYDGIAFPELPLENFMNNNYQTVLSLSQTVNFEGLTLSLQEINKFELQTRLQSLTNLWYKIRKHRITASKEGDIYKRRKDFKTLTDRFKSTRNVTTAAMRRGLACEPVAVSAYSCKLENKVNLYPCGVVVSFSAPWLAASPDRKVYNPERNPPFGLLEIKCPSTSSVLEVNYLKKDETGSLSIKRSHSYYYQVLSQLAVTGLTWCDLYIWCENDDHLETIHFDNILWQQVKDRLDEFFFSYYL
ncbi:hypothetical protein KUTeg_014541 [Tegillarca granosa]|uniref:SWIM-type domain-containing protein n=1 Tax=Tegillarca granosa TaxID=220873 RepID=A0ABQ9ERP5_TEGGR|nr:hypothetical protein KUTeg_014541 [Tegillarca granosa]